MRRKSTRYKIVPYKRVVTEAAGAARLYVVTDTRTGRTLIGTIGSDLSMVKKCFDKLYDEENETSEKPRRRK